MEVYRWKISSEPFEDRDFQPMHLRLPEGKPLMPKIKTSNEDPGIHNRNHEPTCEAQTIITYFFYVFFGVGWEGLNEVGGGGGENSTARKLFFYWPSKLPM